MSRIEQIRGKKVVPGEEVCIVEEFTSGIGTYEEDGVVRATLSGIVEPDTTLRVVHVRPKVKLPRMPSRGDIVYAVTHVVRDEIMIAKIVADGQGKKYLNPFTGLLHISQASDRFVKDLYEVVRVGDLIKAKVLGYAPPYNLTLKEPRLGVVLGFCSICGGLLKKLSTDTLKCPECGNVEKRKVSLDYGNVKGF